MAGAGREAPGLEGEIAYETISPVYDEFAADHDYDPWLGNLTEAGASRAK